MPTFSKTLKATGTPRFSGEAGHALSTPVKLESAGVTGADVLDEGPVPPEFRAATLKLTRGTGDETWNGARRAGRRHRAGLTARTRWHEDCDSVSQAWFENALCGVRSRFNRDRVTQIAQLVERSIFGLFGVARDEVVAAEVAVDLTRLQHVPDGDEHGVLEGDDRLDGTTSGRETTVLGRVVGVVRVRRRQGGNAERALEIGVARTGVG